MNTAWTLLLSWVVTLGLVGFVLMGVDKARAIGRAWRIPERAFFGLAFLGGAFGVLLGSSVFRHKTLKAFFMGMVILSAVLWLGVLFAFQTAFGSPFG